MYNISMRKFLSVNVILVLLLLCGCSDKKENTDTRFMLNTFVKLTAACDDDTLDGAFEVCKEYENKLSRTVETSEVSLLNSSNDFVEVSSDTREIIDRSIYYSEISGGKFDITVCELSNLWDFENQIIPSKDEIAEALKNIDYQSIEINGNMVNLNGKKIDLGAVAKGYIADRLLEYFKEKGVTEGIINLGGNVLVFGKEYNVGIQTPFEESEVSAVLKLKDKSAVTSGIYQRYIEKDGVIYHHILDKETGYGVENDLLSVTIIGDSSFDCDALSTVCFLIGKEQGTELIESLSGYEAVFIDKNGELILTSGLKKTDKNTILLK